MREKPVLIDATQLTRLVADIFTRAGCSEAEAERIGRYLVSANLVGHDSHGVVRVPRYVRQLRDGSVLAARTVDVVRETPVMAVLDGKYGFGQTVAPQAVAGGIEKAAASRAEEHTSELQSLMRTSYAVICLKK